MKYIYTSICHTKKVSIIIAGLIIFSLLISCTSSSMHSLDKSNPVNITLWHYYKGSQNEVFQDYLSEFNNTVGKEHGIVVSAVGMRSVSELYQQLIQSANNEPGFPELPNIAMVYPDAANTLYTMDLLSSFDQYFEKNELETYVSSFMDEGRFTNDQNLYIFPCAKSTEALMVNDTVYKNFLADYNAAYPESKLSEEMLSTFEGIEKTAKSYYEWTDAKTPDVPYDGRSFFGMDSISNYAIVGYHQLGNNFFTLNDDGTGDINFDREAFQRLWDCYYVPMVKGYFAAYSFYRAEDVQTGDILMYTGSTAGASFFPTTVTYKDNTKIDIELKALPFPVFEGGKKTAVQQGAGMIITKSTPKKEYAATIFLKWLTDPVRNTKFVLQTGYLPVTYKALENVLPNELSSISDDPHLKNTAQVISLALDMRDEYSLYTYQPFKNSEDIRFYFEDIFLEKAKLSREAFVKLLDNGYSYEDAEKQLLSEEVMNNFIEEVQHEIQKWQN